MQQLTKLYVSFAYIEIFILIILFSGLWEVCFKDFEDIHHWYDTRFTGCWWVFEEEFYIIGNIILLAVNVSNKIKFLIKIINNQFTK